jgi:Bacterial Ig-like domain (group 2)
MTSSTRLALLLSLQLAAGAAFIACGDDSGGEDEGDGGTPSTDTGGSGNNAIPLALNPMYSAFVPNHEAQVPVQLKDTSLRNKGAKFTSSDPTVASVVDTAEGGLVTIKKEGTTTIKATLDGDTGNAKLTVKAFTEAQWKVGQDRFSKSELAIVPTDGSEITALSLINPAARNANGACNTCHTQQAKTLKIENGPAQIAGYSDDELITIFTKGMKPEGAIQKTMIPPFAWGMFHAWTVTEEEKQGLIAFLRTQQPKANGAIDYGVVPCGDAGAPTGTGMPQFCDKNGKPISIPGMGGSRDGGTAAPDAGATTTGDAGTTPAGDAGTTAAGDAG